MFTTLRSTVMSLIGSRVLGVVVAGVGAVLLAACTGPSVGAGPVPASPVTQSPSPSGTAATGAAGGGALTIVFDDGDGKRSTWTLSCDPPGGTHPDPAAACRALDEFGTTALPAVPSGKMCTQIFGGLQTAVITGSWREGPVSSRLSRTNGCEITRWDALMGLLPKVGS